MPKTRVKLCGMFRDQDIAAVNEAQPDYCGFIVNFPKSHRNVSAQQAQELASLLNSGITPVAVVVNQPVADVADLVNDGVITTVQLHGTEDESYLQSLRDAAPAVTIIKAFEVRTAEDVTCACASSADLILLDSGKGSGSSFDWSVTAAATRPFLLAGGLNSGNVATAIEAVHPWGVDLSSGIETDKVKDPTKMQEVMNEITDKDRSTHE